MFRKVVMIGSSDETDPRKEYAFGDAVFDTVQVRHADSPGILKQIRLVHLHYCPLLWSDLNIRPSCRVRSGECPMSDRKGRPCSAW